MPVGRLDRRDVAPSPEQAWMKMALGLAARGRPTVSPNPMVGAVVVKDGQMVGAGWHRRAGTAHAEVLALSRAGDAARGATVYVNLEPCAHQGRTPACAPMLAEAGVARVVAAMQDPDSRTAGRGLEILRAAGIEVQCGLLEDQARSLNETFIHHRVYGRPFVIYKSAISLDGRSAAADGSSRWITGEKARKDVHRLRRACDAICAGVGTVLADDPRLTVRGPAAPRPPLRVVVDSAGRTPRGAQVLSAEAPTVVVTALTETDPRLDHIRQAGATVISAPGNQGRVSLFDMLKRLGERGVLSLLLEGGATLAGGFAAAGLIDKIVFYLAPTLLGEAAHGGFSGWAPRSIDRAVPLGRVSVARLGPDLRVTAYPDFGVCSPG